MSANPLARFSPRPSALVYEGPLGAVVADEVTRFHVWAPNAESVQLLVFNGEGGTQEALGMTRGDRGEWSVELAGNHEGLEYLYRVDGREAVDPYARAVTANGLRSVAIDVDKLLGTATRLDSVGDPGNAIIYEAHVRDLTIAPGNGIAHKGKFLGLAEEGRRTARGNLSGLDYIASLGITHLQLLPIFDFGSVDELGDLAFDAQYNWGYDPNNYNVPEGSYSTDPRDPYARLRELRQLVDACHARGLRVIMDVVYNHVYDARTNPFELIEPGYYFRKDAWGDFYDATVCGNETASERPMMRRFIVDSVRYWARTFGLDGFRFDLMGIHDVETMNAVRAALDEIDPGIILLGEGWAMGNHAPGVVPADQRAGALMPRIAMFNDTFRDVVKGSNFHIEGAGFVSGNPSYLPDDADPWTASPAAEELFDAMRGSLTQRDYLTAAQSVVYNESHDNYTMFDKLRGTAGLEHASLAEIARRHTLATTIQLLSRGIAFVHAGQELLRTKQGEENSYRSPDHVNAFDYDRAEQFAPQVAFFRSLVAFRRQWSWVTETDYETIDVTTVPVEASGLHLSYRVKRAFSGNDAWVLINADSGLWQAPIAAGKYRVHICDEHVVEDPAKVRFGEEFPVAALSVVVLEKL